MKIAPILLALTVLFAKPSAQARVQQAESYPKFVYQGDTLVLKAKLGHQYVRAFGQERHYADIHGYSYIGIPVDQTPAAYLFDDDKEIEIRAREFPEESWRKHPPVKKSKKRIEEEAFIGEAFNSAYPDTDLTGGRTYTAPLAVIDVTSEFAPIHLGVDLRTKNNKLDLHAKRPVTAINKGVVRVARKFSNEGLMVIIYHGLGIYSAYMHLSEFKVSEGQIVEWNRVIGFSGATGHANGPHLDFRVKIQGVYVNPLSFIETANKHL